MKKKIIILLSILLLTGCTVNYNLEIDDNTLKEKITGTVIKEESKQDSKATDISTIYSIINEEQKPIYNKEELYQKTLKDNGNNIDYTFSYNYTMKDFVNSTIINTCFENHEIEELDNYYSIRLSGNFYCLYSKKVNISVTSNLEVASNNADKIKDNTYIWTIDKNNTDIELVVDKNTPYTKPIKRGISSTFRIVCFIVLVVLSLVVYILYRKKNSSEI